MKAGLFVLFLCLAGVWAATLWRPAVSGKFAWLEEPRPAPEIAFLTRDGRPRHLADFRGRFVLVNLWATWCGPCVGEMPSLDRAQQKFGDRLQILAISEDRGGGAVVRPFLEMHRVARLASCSTHPLRHGERSRRACCRRAFSSIAAAAALPSSRVAWNGIRRRSWRNSSAISPRTAFSRPTPIGR